MNFGERSDLVQVRGRWVFNPRVKLRNHTHQLVFAL